MSNKPTPTTKAGEIIPAHMTALAQIPEMTDDLMLQLTFERAALAPTIEDAMRAPDEGVSLADLEGQIVTIHACWRRETDVKDAKLPYYLIIDVEDSKGARMVASNGSAQVLAVLARAVVDEALPLKARIMLGRKKDGQNAPIFLVNQAYKRVELNDGSTF